MQPTEKDIAGAPALIIVPTAGMTPLSAEWQSFIALLDPLASAGALAGKVAAVIDAGDSQTVASFSSALTARGFALITADGQRRQGARPRRWRRDHGHRGTRVTLTPLRSGRYWISTSRNRKNSSS